MSINQIPTVFVGIGGVGCRIAGMISKDLLEERENMTAQEKARVRERKQYIGIVGVDTDRDAIEGVRSQYPYIDNLITISNNNSVSEYLDKYPDCKKWFPRNNLLQNRTMLNGAGQIRALSRLAFTAAVNNGDFAPLFAEIQRVRKVTGAVASGDIVIVLVGSMTGGTGAGLFIQLPLYIRQVLKSDAGIKRCTIRGLFIGPEVTESYQTEDFNQEAVHVNAYACIRELNAFYLHHTLSKRESKYLDVDYYDNSVMSSENVPYDYLYIFNKSGNLGAMGAVTPETVEKYVADIAFQLLFVPKVTSTSKSVEDNYILGSIQAQAMNRYAGIGMCRLFYPRKDAQKYVLASTVKRLVEEKWLLIDREVESEKKSALAQKKHATSIKVPDRGESYIRFFEAETIDKSTGSEPQLKDLAEEAFTFDSVTKKHTVKVRVISKIEERIKELLRNDSAFQKMVENCKISKTIDTPDVAREEADELNKTMGDLMEYAKNFINDKPFLIADELFPLDKNILVAKKDAPICLYGYLAPVHPCVTRYLLYKMISDLNKKIKELGNKIDDAAFGEYLQYDYDDEEEEIQDANQAVDLAKKRMSHPRRMITKITGDYTKDLQVFTDKLVQLSGEHVAKTNALILRHTLYRVSTILAERLSKMSDNYEIFFSSLKQCIEQNEKTMKALENISFSYGQEGVYCGEIPFKNMATAYYQETESARSLSKETKKKIYEKIFFIQSDDYSKQTPGFVESAMQQAERIRKTKEDLNKVFQDAVCDGILKDIYEDGSSIINLNILEALEREYAETIDKKEWPSLEAYIHHRSEAAIRIAKPMLITNTIAQKTGMFFVAVPTKALGMNMKVPGSEDWDIGTVKDYCIDTVKNANVQVLLDDEFDETELVYLNMQYNYRVEDLGMFAKGGKTQTLYKKRLDQVKSGCVRIDGGNVAVNPHLNCFWHEDAFLPDIDPKVWKKDKLDRIKAFVYGLGFDKFELDIDSDHDTGDTPRLSWFVTADGINYQQVKRCRKLIGNSFFDLYESIGFNGSIKRTILSDAKMKTKRMHTQNPDIRETLKDILSNVFVEDLIQKDRQLRSKDEQNVFNIFMDMRLRMIDEQEEWEALFEGLFETLKEFLSVLLADNRQSVSKALRKIVDEIYANCDYVIPRTKKTGIESDKKLLQSQYKRMKKWITEYTNADVEPDDETEEYDDV